MVAIPTVLGTVAIIFAWIVGYYNGGILNAVFEPTKFPNDTVTFALQFNEEMLMEYGISVLKGNMSVKLLEVLPESLGGGEKGIKQARDNPSHVNVFLVGPLVVLVIIIIALLFIFLISLVCCCCGRCCKPSRRKSDVTDSGEVNSVHYQSYDDNENEIGDSEQWDEYFEKVDGKVDNFLAKSKFVKERQDFVCCCCHMVAVVLVIAYAVGLIFSVGFYFSAASELASALDSKNVSDSDIESWINGDIETVPLLESITYGLNRVTTFVETSIENAEMGTNQTIDELTHILQSNVNTGVTSIIDAVITGFSIKDAISGMKKFVLYFKKLAENVIFISGYRDPFLLSIQGLENMFIILKGKIGNECRLDPTAHGCPEITTASDNTLSITLNPADITLIPQNFVVEVANLNDKLNQILTEITKIEDEVKEMEKKVSETIIEKLDLNQYLSSLSSIWDELNGTLSELVNQVRPSFESLPTFLNEYMPYFKLALYGVGVLMVMIAIILVIFAVLLIFEAFYGRLFSITGKSASLLAYGDYRRPRSRVCRNGCVCCTALFFLVMFILLAILAAVVLIITALFVSEVCPYVANQNEVPKTDFVVNGYLTNEWPGFTDSLFGPTTGGQADTLKQILNLPQPENMWSTMMFTCGNASLSSLGLIGHLGMHHLVNLNALIESPEIKTTLDDAKDSITKTVIDQNLQLKVPSLLDVATVVPTIETFIKLLKGSETNELLKKAIQPKEKFSELEELIKQSTKGSIRDLLPEMETVTVDAGKQRLAAESLGSAYLGVAEGEKLGSEFKIVEASVDNLRGKLSNASITQVISGPFDTTINGTLTDVSKEGNEAFDILTDKVLPCRDLSYGIRAIVYAPCSDAGLFPRLFAWGLLVMTSVLLAFLLFAGIFNLWCIQNHQIRRFAKAHTEVTYE